MRKNFIDPSSSPRPPAFCAFDVRSPSWFFPPQTSRLSMCARATMCASVFLLLVFATLVGLGVRRGSGFAIDPLAPPESLSDHVRYRGDVDRVVHECEPRGGNPDPSPTPERDLGRSPNYDWMRHIGELPMPRLPSGGIAVGVGALCRVEHALAEWGDVEFGYTVVLFQDAVDTDLDFAEIYDERPHWVLAYGQFAERAQEDFRALAAALLQLSPTAEPGDGNDSDRDTLRSRTTVAVTATVGAEYEESATPAFRRRPDA